MTQKLTFSNKLDELSENILYVLSLDSRISLSELASKLGVTRKLVEHRVNYLYENKIISPILIINSKNYKKACVFFRLYDFRQDIFNLVSKMSNLYNVKEALGYYDLVFDIESKKNSDINKKIDKIDDLFHNKIINIDIMNDMTINILGFKCFCHNPSLSRKVKIIDSLNYRINEDDLKLLKILQQNPMASYKEIGISSGWSYVKIREMITHLKKSNVLRFSINIDYRSLGLEYHNILLKVNTGKINEFEKKIIQFPYIFRTKKGSGRWNYVLSICAKDINHFIDITRELRTEIIDYIFDFGTLISRRYK
jgi:DNA-binding Lrp family transcriptional regulator